MLISLVSLVIRCAASTQAFIVGVPFGLTPGATCRYYGYGDAIGSTSNISYLLNTLNSSGYQEAYLAAYNGDYRGSVLHNTGAIDRYNSRYPVNAVFCEGYAPGSSAPGATVGAQEPSGFGADFATANYYDPYEYLRAAAPAKSTYTADAFDARRPLEEAVKTPQNVRLISSRPLVPPASALERNAFGEPTPSSVGWYPTEYREELPSRATYIRSSLPNLAPTAATWFPSESREAPSSESALERSVLTQIAPAVATLTRAEFKTAAPPGSFSSDFPSRRLPSLTLSVESLKGSAPPGGFLRQDSELENTFGRAVRMNVKEAPARRPASLKETLDEGSNDLDQYREDKFGAFTERRDVRRQVEAPFLQEGSRFPDSLAAAAKKFFLGEEFDAIAAVPRKSSVAVRGEDNMATTTLRRETPSNPTTKGLLEGFDYIESAAPASSTYPRLTR